MLLDKRYSETRNVPERPKSFIEELKNLQKSLPDLIEKLETHQIDNADAALSLASTEYDGPINILEIIAFNPNEHASRLNASNINEKYWINGEKAIRALASDESNHENKWSGPPFSDFGEISKRLSKLKIYSEKRPRPIFDLSGLEARHFDDCESALNISSGAFYIADSLAAQKTSIIAKTNDFDSIAKKAMDLSKLISEIQTPIFGFLAGSVLSKSDSEIFLYHFLNLQGLLSGLDVIQKLGDDLKNSEQLKWLLGDQISGQRAKLPLFAFVHLMSSFIHTRSGLNSKHLPVNKTNKRFIAECLRELGVEYSDRRVASAMEYLRDKKPSLKTVKI